MDEGSLTPESLALLMHRLCTTHVVDKWEIAGRNQSEAYRNKDRLCEKTEQVLQLSCGTGSV